MQLLSRFKGKKYVLGYDLDDENAQISFLSPDSDMPETLSILAGEELYNIPAVLCKRAGVGQWFYGKEALRRLEAGGNTPVRHLLSQAVEGKPVSVDGAEYDPVALLTLFIKRSLSLLSMEMSLDNIAAIVFTVADLDQRMAAVFSGVREGLGLPPERIYYQSHEESFYYYMLYQPQALTHDDVLACDYDYRDLTVYHMRANKKTTPIVVTIDKEVYQEMLLGGGRLPDDDNERQRVMGLLDGEFGRILEPYYKDQRISAVYLLGEGFKEGWMTGTLQKLGRDSRLFQGNNLFSKGASIAARERIVPGELAARYILLGRNKLRSNLGLRVNKQGEEHYEALVDAGTNWYEVHAVRDLILADGSGISIEKTPLTGGEPITVTIDLEGLPKRPKKTTRLRFSLDMTEAGIIHVTVADMGFGELFPSTGATWEQTFHD